MKTSTVEYLEKRIAPATIFVTNLNDDLNAGSLRKAIADANDTLAPDTIIFKPTAFGTIVLGGTDLDITTPLTIKGPGAGKVIISGSNSSRIFNIDDGNGAKDTPVTISGLALVNGNDSDGGAIKSLESLTIVNSIISGNTASSDGGGIYVNTSGKFTMTGTTVSNNTAIDGGGLYLEVAGGISITNSTISGNTATSGKGGGAYISTNLGPNPTAKNVITNTTIVGNRATGNGGGLYLAPDGRDISVINSTIIGNTAGGIGGGISMASGGLLLKGGILSGNTADSGGGIFVQVLPGKTSTITGTKILNNTATVSNGGGIQFDGSGSATATFNVLKSTIAGNRATTGGGGISASNGGKLNLSGDTIFANEAANSGGGVFTDGSASSAVILKVTASTFTENTAGRAGGIYTGGDGAVTIAKSKLIANHATNNFGGGAYLRSLSLITITSTLFSKNSAADTGGGLCVITSNTTLTGCTFTDNVTGNDGGGAFIFSTNLAITKTLIRGNIAGSDGGGLTASTTTTTISKSIITGNIAGNNGGGINSLGGNTELDAATKLFGNIARVNPNKDF